VLVDEETGAGSFGVRRGLCVRAALALGGDQSSQSGAYAQTAPQSKYAVTRVGSSPVHL